MTAYPPMTELPQRHCWSWRRPRTLDSLHCYYDPSIIIIRASRPEPTLSLSQDIHTGQFHVFREIEGVCIFSPMACPMVYQIHFQRGGGFFFHLSIENRGPIFFRLRRSVVAAHAMRPRAQTHRDRESRHYPLYISVIAFWAKICIFTVKVLNSFQDFYTSTQPHKLEFTIMSIINACLMLIVCLIL